MKKYSVNIYARNTEDLPALPERRLLTALIKRAVFDLMGRDAAAASDAREWIFDESPDRAEFSFPWVCEQLDLNVDELLARMKNSGPVCRG